MPKLFARIKNQKLYFYIILVVFYLFFYPDLYSLDDFVTVWGESPSEDFYIQFTAEEYDRNKAVNTALEEIRVLLSYMVFGCEFEYQVADKRRNMDSDLQLQFLDQIKKGDPGLVIWQTDEKGMIFRVKSIFNLSQFQKKYIESWHTTTANKSNGVGTNTIQEGWLAGRNKGRKKAFENAILHAARKKYKAKPLFLKGKFLLLESPLTSIRQGEFQTSVRILVVFNSAEYEYYK